MGRDAASAAATSRGFSRGTGQIDLGDHGSMAMKRIAVLTSGGDAPGMNAALRAVVRVGVSSGLEVMGVRQGYTGLIGGQLQPLGPRDVASIIHVGGTMLGSARCAEFRTPEGRKAALQVLEKNMVEGLVLIGGNGSPSGGPAPSPTRYPPPPRPPPPISSPRTGA